MLSPLAPRREERPVSPDYAAFCVVPRLGLPPVWIRCGAATVEPDGSLLVRLDALPPTGELHLRPLPSEATRPATLGLAPAPVKPLHA
jgi:hypothetical protein